MYFIEIVINFSPWIKMQKNGLFKKYLKNTILKIYKFSPRFLVVLKKF